MTNKTIREYTEDIRKSFDNYVKQGTPEWTYQTAAKDLPYQVGSLTKALMQYDGERYAEGLSRDDLKTVIADELADIFSLVLIIATELDISLEDAWEHMLKSDERKVSERS